jgi:hypothetical protein
MFDLKNQSLQPANSYRGVAAIEVDIVVENCNSGIVNVTDIMLQGGTISTIWTGHPAEIRWSLDG